MFLLRILLKIILAPVSLVLLVSKGVIHLAINQSYICSGWPVSALCWICLGLLPCDTEMDRSLYLLCCWNRSYRYSLFGGDPGGDDR